MLYIITTLGFYDDVNFITMIVLIVLNKMILLMLKWLHWEHVWYWKPLNYYLNIFWKRGLQPCPVIQEIVASINVSRIPNWTISDPRDYISYLFKFLWRFCDEFVFIFFIVLQKYFCTFLFSIISASQGSIYVNKKIIMVVVNVPARKYRISTANIFLNVSVLDL